MPRGKPERRNIVPPSGATGSKPPPQLIMLPAPLQVQTSGLQGISRRSSQPRNVFTRINAFLIRSGRRG